MAPVACEDASGSATYAGCKCSATEMKTLTRTMATPAALVPSLLVPGWLASLMYLGYKRYKSASQLTFNYYCYLLWMRTADAAFCHKTLLFSFRQAIIFCTLWSCIIYFVCRHQTRRPCYLSLLPEENAGRCLSNSSGLPTGMPLLEVRCHMSQIILGGHR